MSQKKGSRARRAGEGGTATTRANCRVESPQSQMPHGVSGETFVFCGLFFPSRPPKSFLCQTLTPGVTHHVFINRTCRATGPPIALMCEPQGNLRSTQQKTSQSHSRYLREPPIACETSASKTLMCNCHFYHLNCHFCCLNLEQRRQKPALGRVHDDVPNTLKSAIRIFPCRLCM